MDTRGRHAPRAATFAQRADPPHEGARLRQGLSLCPRRGGRVRGRREVLSRRDGAAAVLPAGGAWPRIAHRRTAARAEGARGTTRENPGRVTGNPSGALDRIARIEPAPAPAGGFFAY